MGSVGGSGGDELVHLLVIEIERLLWLRRAESQKLAHGLFGEVAARDQQLVSLKVWGMSSGPADATGRAFRQWVLRSLSARGLAHVVVLQLSRLLRSFVGLGGPDELRSLPGQDRCRSRRRGGGRGGAWLERLLAGEDVPGGDQDLARDGGLGGVALAVAVLGVGVEAVPWVGRAPGLLGGLDGGPAQRVRAGLGELAGA